MKHVLATMKVSDGDASSRTDWYPDTSATHHVTNDPQHLLSTVPYEGNGSVIVGNGEFLPISHIGFIPPHGLSGNLNLNDVLVCPNITTSLLSVSKLTDDYPCEFTFDSTQVYVKEKLTKHLLSHGKKDKCLYLLDNPQFMAFYSARQ